MKLIRKATFAVGVSLLAIGTAHAQSAPHTPPSGTLADTPKRSGELETIVVTAQKRETKLETTPVTVNVVTGAMVAEQGVREVKDLKASVPGLTVNESPGGLAGISVRGIGSSASNQLVEQSVGLFVDGIYNPRSRQFRNAIFDVERIEVIKGSQGVLFGKNTSIGAISVTSRGPGSTTGGYTAGNYGINYDSWSAEGAVDLAASDSFKMRVAGLYSDEGGFVRNITLNRDEPREKRGLIRSIMKWQPSENLTATLKLQSGWSHTIGNSFEILSPSTGNTTFLPSLGVLDNGTQDFIKYESSGSAGEQFDRQRSFDPSLKLDLRLGDYTLTSLTGYSNLHFSNGYDSDSTPLYIVYSTFNEHYKQFSQEIRLTSPAGRPIEYIVGAFYQKARDQFALVNNFNGFLGFLTGALSTSTRKPLPLSGNSPGISPRHCVSRSAVD